MHGCDFKTTQGYVEPIVDEALYLQLPGDALQGIGEWLPRLGVTRTRQAWGASRSILGLSSARFVGLDTQAGT